MDNSINLKEIRQIIFEHVASISDEQFEEELRQASIPGTEYFVEGEDLSQ